MRPVKSYMRRLRKTTKQPAGWPETISNEPELPNPSPGARFIWDVYETHTENNLELKWRRDAIRKCHQISDATANFTTLPRNLYETNLSHIKVMQIYMRHLLNRRIHFLTTLPSKKHILYETPARNETRYGWGSHDNTAKWSRKCSSNPTSTCAWGQDDMSSQVNSLKLKQSSAYGRSTL